MVTIREATITDMAGTDMADTMVAPAIAITGQEMAIEAVAVAAPPKAVIEEAMPEGIEAAAVDLVEEIREASEAIVAESRAAGAAGFTAAVEVVSMEEAVDSTAEAVDMAVVTVADATEKYSIGGRSKRSGRFFIFARRRNLWVTATLQWRPEARLARLCYLGRVLVRVSRD